MHLWKTFENHSKHTIVIGFVLDHHASKNERPGLWRAGSLVLVLVQRFLINYFLSRIFPILYLLLQQLHWIFALKFRLTYWALNTLYKISYNYVWQGKIRSKKNCVICRAIDLSFSAMPRYLLSMLRCFPNFFREMSEALYYGCLNNHTRIIWYLWYTTFFHDLIHPVYYNNTNPWKTLSFLLVAVPNKLCSATCASIKVQIIWDLARYNFELCTSTWKHWILRF